MKITLQPSTRSSSVRDVAQRQLLSKERKAGRQITAKLLEVNRTSAYYKPKEPSEAKLAAQKAIDEIHTGKAFEVARPEILSSNQRSQFTSADYIRVCGE